MLKHIVWRIPFDSGKLHLGGSVASINRYFCWLAMMFLFSLLNFWFHTKYCLHIPSYESWPQPQPHDITFCNVSFFLLLTETFVALIKDAPEIEIRSTKTKKESIEEWEIKKTKCKMRVMANTLHFIKHVQLKNIAAKILNSPKPSAGIENHLYFLSFFFFTFLFFFLYTKKLPFSN